MTGGTFGSEQKNRKDFEGLAELFPSWHNGNQKAGREISAFGGRALRRKAEVRSAKEQAGGGLSHPPALQSQSV
jgi:hypothetical protein